MKGLALIASLSFAISAFVLLPDSAENVLIIDPGHGGHDVGFAVGDQSEAALNWKWAEALAEKARERGYTVQFTREGDHFLHLKDRITLANSTEDAVLVSIHMDSNTDNAKSGARLFASAECSDEWSEKTEALSHALNDLTTCSFSKSENLYVLREFEGNAWMIHPGFMSNEEDLSRINSPDFRDAFLNHVLDAIE